MDLAQKGIKNTFKGGGKLANWGKNQIGDGVKNDFKSMSKNASSPFAKKLFDKAAQATAIATNPLMYGRAVKKAQIDDRFAASDKKRAGVIANLPGTYFKRGNFKDALKPGIEDS